MKKLIIGLGVAFAASAATVSTPAHAQQKLRLGYSLSPTSHYGIGATIFMNEIARRTNGRITVQDFPSNALGGEREMVEAAQLGTLDLVVTSTGPVGNFVPDTMITDIPFLFRDYDHARRALDGPLGQAILAKCVVKELVCLAWWENGFRHLTNSKRAVNSPDDMKGLKVRTMENQVHMTAFRALGAAPTPMAFPEVFGALQQGTVDGQENPMPVILNAKFAQVQKYISLTGHVYSPALAIMSTASWNKLSKDDQAIFRDAARIGAAANRQKVQADEQVGVAELQKAGMQVIQKVDTAVFQNALKPAYAEYTKRFGQANIDKFRNYK